MTEIEKLRALLAEAREALSQGCWNGKCCVVRQRIDAALAEPVVGCFGCMAANLEGADLIEQRDEARAEIAQWKAKEMRYLSKDVPESFAAGYQRGAEAMREAASRYAHDDCGFYALADAIRALPIPENKL